ncbi:restriction endonuclease [Chitinophagaceae bacterium IBVUCB1]|nr:restriction endonuclease [Chitinophagaceae bacterium IBVUCB1]
MNFRVKGKDTVILMSVRRGAPYADRTEEDGQILIYEGHDVPRNINESTKAVNQPQFTPNGKLTQNGKFHKAAMDYRNGEPPELVKVYEKIKDGIWVYNGIFELIDAWQEKSGKRKVFKFKLRITDIALREREIMQQGVNDLDHNRMIPTSVKLEVWKRDKGKCVTCGSTDNLHFDHILPFSKGGTSLKTENIQLLCARHNLQKRDKIQ